MNKNTIGDIHDNGSVNVVQGVGNIYNYVIKASEKTIYDEEHKPKINKLKLKSRLLWIFCVTLASGIAQAIEPSITYAAEFILLGVLGFFGLR